MKMEGESCRGTKEREGPLGAARGRNFFKKSGGEVKIDRRGRPFMGDLPV